MVTRFVSAGLKGDPEVRASMMCYMDTCGLDGFPLMDSVAFIRGYSPLFLTFAQRNGMVMSPDQCDTELATLEREVADQLAHRPRGAPIAYCRFSEP
jgi:hypothetical protein